MAETRKLVAIMVIEGVGYSRMMDENEAGKRRRVGERRIVQFVTRLLLCMVLRCLGDGRS